MSVVRLPEIIFSIPGGSWPNEPGQAVGASSVEQFYTEREIVSRSLPSQIRGTSGFSIGAGSVTVPQSETPLTPWADSDAGRPTVGDLAFIDAVDEYGNREPLGAWKVASAAGSLGSAGIEVPLAELPYASRKARLPKPASDSVDAIWIIDVLARQLGFYATPPAARSCIASVPGVGGLHAEVGAIAITQQPTHSDALGMPTSVEPRFSIPIKPDGTIYVTINTAKSSFSVGRSRVDINGNRLRLYNGASDRGYVDFATGLDPAHPYRVQVEFSGSSVRIRSAASAAWSAPITGTESDRDIFRFESGSFNGLHISTRADVGLFATPTALFDLLDLTVVRPWLEAGSTLWSAIQSVTESALAATWLDRRGVLRSRSRHGLAGAMRGRTLVDVARSVEAFKWSVADKDFADRLVCTFLPITPPDPDAEVSEWAVGTGKIRIPAQSSAEFVVDFQSPVDAVRGFVWAYDSDGETSTWLTNTQADGEGTEVRDGVSVSLDLLGPSAGLVRVRNSTATPLWLVDDLGDPALIVRGIGVWEQSIEGRVEFGVGEGIAENEATVDLGPLVQTEAEAARVAAFLWDRANETRWRGESIRIPLDLSLDVGDLLNLIDADSGLDSDALITRMRLDGSTGTLAQVLDLAILPPVVARFDELNEPLDVTAFDALWGHLTVSEFDRKPLRKAE